MSEDATDALTPKEKETLRLILRGHDAKSSARALDLYVGEALRDREDGDVELKCAGEVEAVGPGVSEFAVGDAVVSCFFPPLPAVPSTGTSISIQPSLTTGSSYCEIW